MDGKPVEVLDDLMAILDRHKVGDKVMVEVLRYERRQQTTVMLQAIE